MEGMWAAHDQHSSSDDVGPLSPQPHENSQQPTGMPHSRRHTQLQTSFSLLHSHAIQALQPSFLPAVICCPRFNGVRHAQELTTCARETALGRRNWLSRSESSAVWHSYDATGGCSTQARRSIHHREPLREGRALIAPCFALCLEDCGQWTVDSGDCGYLIFRCIETWRSAQYQYSGLMPHGPAQCIWRKPSSE